MRNILFFNEIYPIRNEFTHHSAIATGVFDPLAKQLCGLGHDARIVANPPVLEKLLTTKSSPGNRLIHLTVDEFEDVSKLVGNWALSGRHLWREYVVGETRDEYSVIERILTRIYNDVMQFEFVVLWSHNEYVGNLVRAFGATPVFMELAPMRRPFPMSLYVDPLGVNGSTALNCQEFEDYAKTLEPLSDLHGFFERRNADPMKHVNPIDHLYSFDAHRKVEEKIRTRGERPKVLVPMQIGDDTNLFAGSPFGDTDDFIRRLIPNLDRSRYDFYFKPHPGAVNRGGWVALDQQRAVDRLTNAGFEVLETEVDESTYLSFLTCFDAVVTINSSVGFEAMLLGKSVVNLGNAMYSPSGATDYHAVMSALDEASERKEQNLRIASAMFKICLLDRGAFISDATSFLERIEAVSQFNENSRSEYFELIGQKFPYQTWIN